MTSIMRVTITQYFAQGALYCEATKESRVIYFGTERVNDVQLRTWHFKVSCIAVYEHVWRLNVVKLKLKRHS
jgi:hypothetical protein